METVIKAKELLKEIDRQIAEAEKNLKTLKANRKEISKVVAMLSGKTAGKRHIRKAVKHKAKGRRGRAKRKVAKKKAAGGKRTNWNQVISKFKKPFTLDDLVKVSKKSKGTVNQAVQVLKKAGKIVSTGKRGEYQRAGAAVRVTRPKRIVKE